MDRRKKLMTSLLTGISTGKVDRLLEIGENPGDFFEKNRADWKNRAGLTDRECDILESVRDDREAAEKLEAILADKGISLVTRFDDAYPKRLLQLEEKPFALFVIGRLPDDNRPSAAIVGARACSEYGRRAAEFIAGGLASAGVQIVSGMAYGIDSHSQRASAGFGGTFAVLAGGPDICYPRENRDLYDQLADRGGIISEMPPGTQGIPSLFPRRNRIISGLADAVIVIEAREKSGSLITADFAAEQGRLIYAVPGPIDSQLSAGTNELIRNGAILIKDPAELLEDLRMPVEAEMLREGRKKPERRPELTADEADVLTMVGENPLSIEELLQKSGYPAGTLSGILLRLEVKGAVTRVGMNHFRLS